MERLKHFKWSIVLIIIHLILVLYFSTLLGPEDLIPRRWDYRGEIGSYSSRAFGLWFFWGMNAIIVFAFILFPLYSVRYRRNPDVAAEVFERAGGICENCEYPAPFIKAKDGMPYLEIHSVISFQEGGEDSVSNTIAVCPNCHRKLHLGE